MSHFDDDETPDPLTPYREPLELADPRSATASRRHGRFPKGRSGNPGGRPQAAPSRSERSGDAWDGRRSMAVAKPINLAAILQLTSRCNSTSQECLTMKHEPTQNHRWLHCETKHQLPDGRWLVQEFDQPAKVIDPEGNEITPSLSEVTALLAIADMVFPRKNANGKRLYSLYREDDWALAG